MAGVVKHRIRLSARSRSTLLYACLFLAPACLLLVIFRLLPAVSAFWHAFTQWDGVSAPQPVGLANFAELLGDGVFWTALRNNGILVASVPLWILVSLVLALLIYQEVPGWRFFRGAFFLPSVLSPVIVGTLFTALLRVDGPANQLLQALGLGAAAKDWLGNPATALPTLVLVILWSIFGLGVIVFLAGLAAVPSEIFEAARIDGARGWAYLRHIVVPSLRHVLEFWTVNLIVWSFTSLFAFVYVMTSGGPGYATMLVEYNLYLQAFEFNRMGYACALGTALFLMVFGVVLLQLRLMTGEKE
ncbi:MAG: carbohydrate ABC transporter permease [Armatimonadota bacterium]